MSSLALKYRPKSWNDIVGQETVVSILQRQVATKSWKNVYLFAGAHGCGKAQPLYSKVLTPNGFKKMEDIVVGDIVIDGNGEPTTVTNIFPQEFPHEIYEIKLDDGTAFRVADNHLNSVYYTTKKGDVEEVLPTLALIQVFKKGALPLRIRVPSIQFEEKQLPLDPYFLGVLIGDGSLHKDELSVSLYEEDMYDKISKICKSNGYVLSKKNSADFIKDFRIIKEDNSYYHIGYKGKDYDNLSDLYDALNKDGFKAVSQDMRTIRKIYNHSPFYAKNYPDIFIDYIKKVRRNNEIKRIIRELNLDVMSREKFIPSTYLYSSAEQRLEMLRGLMDTDGQVRQATNPKGKKSSYYYYSTSSKRLSDDFCFLARSLGCTVTVTIKKARIGKKEYSDHYCHYIKVPNGLVIVSSQKHMKKLHTRELPVSKKIVDIQYVGMEECKCIIVKSNAHTYITDGMTVTHNTTTARILANEVNHGEGSPIEIDCASNNGIDTIRGLIADAQQSSIESEYKFYICDEAHNLTKAAWDAALKLIEEPPSNSIFIFCTTNPDKIPETILSRVQRFDFLRISKDIIADRLEFILNEETHSNYERSALERIAVLADGHMRDAIQYMDKCLDATSEVTNATVESVLGLVRYKSLMDLINSLYHKDIKGCLQQFEALKSHNTNLIQVYDMLTDIVIDCAIYAQFKDMSFINIPTEYASLLPTDIAFTKMVVERFIYMRHYLLPNNTETLIKTLFIEICG